MNKKGQVLVMFVILLPFIFLLFAYIVDQCYLLYQKNNQKNTGSIVCKYALQEKQEDKIKQLALENDSKLETIEITQTTDATTITLEKKIDSIFGKLLGIDTYTIKTITDCKN